MQASQYKCFPVVSLYPTMHDSITVRSPLQYPVSNIEDFMDKPKVPGTCAIVTFNDVYVMDIQAVIPPMAVITFVNVGGVAAKRRGPKLR